MEIMRVTLHKLDEDHGLNLQIHSIRVVCGMIDMNNFDVVVNHELKIILEHG